jgi:HEAT repeat protein
MDCHQARELIGDGVSGNLPDPGALEEHLAGCAACRAEWESGRKAWEALGRVAAPALSAGFAQSTRALLREAVSRRRRRARVASWASRGAGWGLAALGGFLVAHLVRKEPAAPPAGEPPPAVVQPALPPSLAALAGGRTTDGGRLRALAEVQRYVHGRAQAPAGLVEALSRTLRLDRNPGVRRKAAEALAQLPQTPEIRDAFLLALRRDSNPVVRIIAIGALARAAQTLDPASIEALRDCANDQEESQHLRVAAARALASI